MMRKLILYVLCLFAISFTVSASPTGLPGTLTETGDLYWDINSEVRLKYIPLCRLSEYGDHSRDTVLHSIINKLDLFSVLGYNNSEKYINCSGRGLRLIYKLREDSLFPIDYNDNNEITINDKALNFATKRYPSLGDYYNSENYQKIYSAIQTNARVIVSVKSIGYSTRIKSIISGKPSILLQRHISIKNIKKSDDLSKYVLQGSVDELNTKIKKKYKFIILYDLLLAIALIVFLILLKARVYPLVKNIFGFSKVLIYKLVGRVLNVINLDSKIIKADKLKTYSVSDELLRWAKLKEDGHISDLEYEEARKKLLDRK